MRPLLYTIKSPGSKCWFLPYAKSFLGDWTPKTIVEPFGGSAVVGLTLLHEGYTRRLVLAEKDAALRQFWESALNDREFAIRVGAWTENLISTPSASQSEFVLESLAKFQEHDPAFWILLNSRFSYNGKRKGGFMTEGTRGVASRWPSDVAFSLQALHALRHQITVLGDAFEALDSVDGSDTYSFVDPPYSMNEFSPGKDLYREFELDHNALLNLLARRSGGWQLTSEHCPEIVSWCKCTGLDAETVSMSSGTGVGGSSKKTEVVVSKAPDSLESSADCSVLLEVPKISESGRSLLAQ